MAMDRKGNFSSHLLSLRVEILSQKPTRASSFISGTEAPLQAMRELSWTQE